MQLDIIQVMYCSSQAADPVLGPEAGSAIILVVTLVIS
jgi:hypothetical protein